MLQWNDLHAYNAVHVVRIAGVLDVGGLRRAIALVLERHGLTRLTLGRRAGSYEYAGGPASAEIKILGRDENSSLGVDEEIEHQLNTPFPDDGCFSPFRFFVLPLDNSFSLGLVYFHAVADAESVLMVLKDVVVAYRGAGDPAFAKSVERYLSRWDSLFSIGPRVLARKLVSLPASIRNMRRSLRPRYHDAGNLDNRFTRVSLSADTLSGMIRLAKSLGVTLNDLFLALLMKALSRVNPKRVSGSRRKGISLGCVVNVRKDLGLDDRRVFGLLLGSFVVHHGDPVETSLAELADAIGSQTLRIKLSRLYLGAGLEMAFGRLMISCFSPKRRPRFYQKHYPLCGGLSNMNLNPLWRQVENARPLEYLRAVSTGPVTPLVLSITTIGQGVSIGITYRATAFGEPEIERIKGCFLAPPAPSAVQP
jgi:hypothetical protein